MQKVASEMPPGGRFVDFDPHLACFLAPFALRFCMPFFSAVLELWGAVLELWGQGSAAAPEQRGLFFFNWAGGSHEAGRTESKYQKSQTAVTWYSGESERRVLDGEYAFLGYVCG